MARTGDSAHVEHAKGVQVLHAARDVHQAQDAAPLRIKQELPQCQQHIYPLQGLVLSSSARNDAASIAMTCALPQCFP